MVYLLDVVLLPYAYAAALHQTYNVYPYSQYVCLSSYAQFFRACAYVKSHKEQNFKSYCICSGIVAALNHLIKEGS